MVDLIQSLTADMDASPHQARLIAARLLSHVDHQLRERFGAASAEEFRRRVLDWRGWDSGAPGQADPWEKSAIGTDATLVEILGHVGVDPVKAGIALPALTAYLKHVLAPEQLRLVFQVAPFLATAAPERHPGFIPPQPPPIYGQ